MLQRTTTHCAHGHELELRDKGARVNKIPASTIKAEQVALVAWCDVCVEPFLPPSNGGGLERWSCSICNYDCCWECHDSGREAYLLQLNFTTGPKAGQTVWGTFDVLKSKLNDDDLTSATANDQDEVIAVSAMSTLDVDLFDVGLGKEMFSETSQQVVNQVIFSRATGQVSKLNLNLTWKDKSLKKQYREFGAGIETLTFNLETLAEPIPDEVKSSSNWFGVAVSYPAGGPESFIATGTMSFERFGLAQIPGFGSVAADNNVIKLLQQIAKDKKMLIDPMRQKTAPPPFLSMCARWNVTPVDFTKNADKVLPTRLDRMLKDKESAEIMAALKKEQDGLNVVFQTTRSTGRINPKDLIYCARLSLMAYLIDQVPFGIFFPEDRERYLLDPLWSNYLAHLEENEGKELLRQWIGMSPEKTQRFEDHAHEAFLSKFIASYFVTDQESSDYAQSRTLNADDGPLQALGLEYASVFPGKTGKEGALQFGGIEAFIAVSKVLLTEGGDICIVFQGTNDPRDFTVSLNGFTTPFEPLSDGANAGYFSCLQGRGISDNNLAESKTNKMRVHLGFYNAFLRLRPYIDAYLRKTLPLIPKDKNVRIVVTGHSLGGALATMCTAYLFQLFDETLKGSVTENYEIISGEITGKSTDRLRILTVTFGSPKVGTPAFIDWLDSHRFLQKTSEGNTVRAKMLRLADVCDPITKLPPSSGVFSYLHSSKKAATVDTDGTMLFIQPDAAKMFDTASRGVGDLVTNGKKAIQNHDLFLYLHKCLHFAWVLAKLDDESTWSEDPLGKAFGAETYQYDDYVRSGESFRNTF